MNKKRCRKPGSGPVQQMIVDVLAHDSGPMMNHEITADLRELHGREISRGCLNVLLSQLVKNGRITRLERGIYTANEGCGP